MAVENDLRTEGRMAGHLDRDMAPVRIQDVERVVVDVAALRFQVADHASLDRCTSHTVATARPTRIRKSPLAAGFFSRCSSAILCLRSSLLQSRMGIPFRFGKRSHTTAEPSSHPHQVGIVELLLRTIVQPAPPGAEATR